MKTEIPLKQWFHEEAERRHFRPWTVIKYFYRNPARFKLNIRRINKRVVLVVQDQH